MKAATFLILGFGLFCTDTSARVALIQAPIETGGSSGISRTFHKRCQSFNSCSFRVTMFDQGSSEIVDALGGNRNGCAPTASAMLITAFLNEMHPSTNPMGKMKTFSETVGKGSKVRLLADGMMMNPSNGNGTLPFNAPFINNMTRFLKNNFKFSGAKEFTYDSVGSIISYPRTTQSDFIKDIRKNKNGYLLTATSHKKKGKRWVREGDTFARLGGHILALTGFNGDRLQIHDPWGVTYFVKAQQEKLKACTLCFKGKKTVLYPITSSRGYVKSRSDEGRKVIIRQYFKLKAY